MTRQEPDIIESIQRAHTGIQKIIKYLNRNKIPNDYQGMKNMIAEMEAEEQRRNEMNKMREKIKKMIRDRKFRNKCIKFERRQKIRKLLHLPYQTLNEVDFFKDTEE